ncbi:carbohydrate ABC transporter permease [Streptomyces azureus]|uniref:Binding-protein-dependent transporters inner membrane component n=1 Tax=Streptomyces azureus TaxID=146537 RepID=A0A0K8PKJ1_STRAJ|nr:carbohydrate ABC transporter permease [Streptomyces azureus]GAP48397.1 binding-protein-dependent transporters inner membrane component [Streptomyces azureus]
MTAVQAVRTRSHRPVRSVVGRYPVLVALFIGALFMVLPFLIVALNAVKSPAEYSANGPLSLPEGVYLDGLKDFWARVDFGQKLVNSILISGSVALLAVVLSVLNAYAIGVGRIKGRTWVLAFFVLANMLPQEALVYPVYYLSKEVGLYDTRLSVIIVFTVVQAAFGTYLLSAVLGQFPREIIEAARIDGANKWQVLWRIVVPVSRPTIGVLLVFFFIWTWNEFLLPLVMLISNDNQTVSVALGVLQGQRLMDATMTNAAALLGVLPAIVFFLVFQRTLTRGIAVGAVK